MDQAPDWRARRPRLLPGQRTLLVINQQSRRGDIDITRGAEILREHGFETQVVTVDEPERISEVIMSRVPEVDFVIMGGGDGTVNAALDALVASKRPLAVLPLGTANDLARTLQIPLDIEGACKAICNGRVHTIDLGRVNGHYFINDASVGLGVDIIHHSTQQRKRRFGVLGYVRAFIDAVAENRSFRATITHEGTRRTMRVVQISVANGRHQGGGLTIASDAAIDDGILDVLCVAPMSTLKLIRLGIAMRLGRHEGHREVTTLHGKRFTLETSRRMRIDTDGEHTTTTPAFFEVIPGALDVIVPVEYLEGAPVASPATG